MAFVLDGSGQGGLIPISAHTNQDRRLFLGLFGQDLPVARTAYRGRPRWSKSRSIPPCKGVASPRQLALDREGTRPRRKPFQRNHLSEIWPKNNDPNLCFLMRPNQTLILVSSIGVIDIDLIFITVTLVDQILNFRFIGISPSLFEV